MDRIDSAITGVVHRIAAHMGGRLAYARQASIAGGLAIAVAFVLDADGDRLRTAVAVPLGALFTALCLWNTRPGIREARGHVPALVRKALLLATLLATFNAVLSIVMGADVAAATAMVVAVALNLSVYHAISAR